MRTLSISGFLLSLVACGPVSLVCDRADVGARVTANDDATGKPETFACVQTTSGGFAWVLLDATRASGFTVHGPEGP